jgi:4-hydroxybenzoate polyprenyltransferase
MLATCAIIGDIDSKILPAILSGVLIHSGGDIINDIYDRGIDKICKPNAVIPSGRMSVRTAWMYLTALTLAALLIALILSRIMFIAYLIGIASGYLLYSHPRFRFKDVPLLGPASVAIYFQLESIGVWSIYAPINREAIVFSGYIFSLIFSLIFLKDFRDVKGDINSLPIMIGVKNAANVSILLTAIPALFLIWLFELFGKTSFLVALLAYSIMMAPTIRILLFKDPVALGKALRHRMILGMTVPNTAISLGEIV